MRGGATPDPPRVDERTAALLAAVRERSGARCSACPRILCGHEVVLSVLLGYKSLPRCAGCLARESGESPADLCERVVRWLGARDCYREAWELAGRSEGTRDLLRPACLFSAVPAPARVPAPDVGAQALLPSDAELDAGDMGCGELVLELRLRLGALWPGAVLRVAARDPAAPVDLPAWCGLTGNRLLSARHPLYWIERRKEA